MIKVVLAGDSCDSRLTLGLCRALCENGGALYIGNENVTQYGEVSTQFLIYEPGKPVTFSADNIIFLFSSPPASPKISISPVSGIAAITGDSEDVCNHAALHGMNAIVCGMSDKSCISVSSVDERQIVISVNQSVTLLSGKTLEPCEFTVTGAGQTDSYTLLYICAVLILCEKFDGSNIKLFGD